MMCRNVLKDRMPQIFEKYKGVIARGSSAKSVVKYMNDKIVDHCAALYYEKTKKTDTSQKKKSMSRFWVHLVIPARKRCACCSIIRM